MNQTTTTSSGFEEPEASADEIFKEVYEAATIAATANGNEESFRWKNNSQPFPYQEASWAQAGALTCDGGDKAHLDFRATTYDQDLGTEDFLAQVEKVRAAWQARGWEVRTVLGDSVLMMIAIDLDYGSTVVYTAGRGGEEIEATTRCFTVFEGDEREAQAQPIPGARAEDLPNTPVETPTGDTETSNDPEATT